MFASLATLKQRRSELDAMEAEWLGDLADYDHSGDWGLEHYANPACAISDACHLDKGVAQSHVTLARKLENMPVVAEAFRCGAISRAHAGVIANAFTRDRAEQMATIEDRLVDIAREQTPAVLAGIVNRYTQSIDADGGTDSEDKLFGRRRYHASRSLDNMLNIDALLDPESADIHEMAIQAELDRDQRADDDRTLGQRRADAITNLLRQSLDRGEVGTSHAVSPHVTYVVHLDTREVTGTGGLVDLLRAERQNSGRLSAATLERIMCDCDVTRVVMTGESEILDIGRATRTASPAQWKALVVRDQHCQAPGCQQPPERCEAHHIKHWAPPHYGPTDLANLELLCWHHHRERHKHDAQARAA